MSGQVKIYRDIPYELWGQIFTFCGDQDLINVMTVSKGLSSALKDHLQFFKSELDGLENEDVSGTKRAQLLKFAAVRKLQCSRKKVTVRWVYRKTNFLLQEEYHSLHVAHFKQKATLLKGINEVNLAVRDLNLILFFKNVRGFDGKLIFENFQQKFKVGQLDTQKTADKIREYLINSDTWEMITMLNCSNVGLTRIPTEYFLFPKVRYLKAPGNKIWSLPDQLWEKGVYNLEGNPLTVFPDQMKAIVPRDLTFVLKREKAKQLAGLVKGFRLTQESFWEDTGEYKISRAYTYSLERDDLLLISTVVLDLLFLRPNPSL